MADSGRYQSRLFNFVHQQSRRLTEQCSSAFRHLKYATSWIAPVVLYPIYKLFESSQAAGKRLYQTVQQSWPQLPADDNNSQPQTPPTADTPIQQVLLLVDALPSLPYGERETANGNKHSGNSEQSTEESAPSPRTREERVVPHRPLIQGIATQLSNRTLVLVTIQNCLLDILTAQQQQQLQERIIQEVADYWRYQRIVQLEGSREQGAGSREQGELFRSRGSRGAMVAGEQRKQGRRKNFSPSAPLPLCPPSPHLPISSSPHHPITPAPGSRLPAPSSSGSQSPTLASDGSKAYTLRIQTLIWAAIDYFFGVGQNPSYSDRQSKQIGQTKPKNDYSELPEGMKPRWKFLQHRRSRSYLPSSDPSFPPQSVSTDYDPWLSPSDLFGDSDELGEPAIDPKPNPSVFQIKSQQAEKTNIALPSSQSANYSLKNLLNFFQTILPQPKRASELIKQPSTARNSKLKAQSSRQESVNLSSPSPPLPLSPSPPLPITPAPDWIEIKATATGYIKHPLEQLLEWLDLAMLWLEDAWLRVWCWVQQMWKALRF